ncbi:MAG: hypothetical protein RRY02_07425, partial [Muribaculaceae bacterium]
MCSSFFANLRLKTKFANSSFNNLRAWLDFDVFWLSLMVDAGGVERLRRSWLRVGGDFPTE